MVLLWSTHSFTVFGDGKGMSLIQMGEPVGMEWWSHGRLATAAEIEESIRTGLPTLTSLTLSHTETKALRSAVMEFQLLRMRFAEGAKP